MSKAKRILTIDDDADFNAILKLKMEKELPGFNFDITETPQDFFTKFNEEMPDLCLVDLNLGDMWGAGLKIIEAIRKKIGKEVPIIVLSKISDKNTIDEALSLGSDDYVSKPLDKFLLAQKIRYFLDLDNDEKELVTQAFTQIPKSKSQAYLRTHFSIAKISEEGIYLEAPHFIRKGVGIRVKCPVIDSINQKKDYFQIMTVKECHINSKGLFEMYLPFETEQVEAGLIRRWITTQKNL
jgi:ActR/RegA family two-component response regulator